MCCARSDGPEVKLLKGKVIDMPPISAVPCVLVYVLLLLLLRVWVCRAWLVVDAVACMELGGVVGVDVVAGVMSASMAASVIVVVLFLGFSFVIIVIVHLPFPRLDLLRLPLLDHPDRHRRSHIFCVQEVDAS